MNEQNEFIKNYLHTEYVGCLKTDHEKCIDLQYEEIGNFVQNAGMFGDLEISIKHNGLVLFDTNGIYINKVFPNTEYSRDLSPCCGYGGLTAYANKEMADKMTEKCLERSDSPYITYCMACRDRFVREGRESRHILELLYGINAANMPDISEKRYNRLELKEKLLKNIWNEELMMEKKDYTVAYTEDAISMMDERMILKSDVERVLSDYRENQEAIFDEETKELVTRSRLGNVTFWVRFVETEEGYLVRRAYSHRMNIMKRVGQ